MKIVLATPIYPPEIGGPATYTKELCERLHQSHQITIVAYTGGSVALPGTTLVAVGKHRPLPIRLLKYFWALWRSSRQADLIYVQNAMAAGLPAMLVSRWRHLPLVLKFVGDEAWERASQQRLTTKRLEEFLRGPADSLKIKLMRWIQGVVLRRAQIVITPSAYLREEIINAYKIKPEQAVVVYNAAEKTEVVRFEPHRQAHQIASTGRLVAWKGVDGLIRAASSLVVKFPDLKVIIAGDGPEEPKLKKLTRGKNLNAHVVFLGNVSRAETWQLRKNSAVYVLNSTYEGLPHTILTSFASLTPVVATHISGTTEAVFHEKTGLLVEPGNDRQLAEAIERLFNSPTLVKELTNNGLTLLKEKFSWETHLKKLNQVFESVVTKPAN